MPPTLTRPSDAHVARVLAARRGLPLTYWDRGGTRAARMPAGYEHAETSVPLGRGEAIWQAARAALQTWSVFPIGDWCEARFAEKLTAADPADARPPLAPGAQVAVAFRLLGLWWLAPDRVVYVVDEPDRFGFAYGTLPGHVEQGEERFLVERDPATGEVRYGIRMMARARHWGARLLPGLTRRMQERFRRESCAAVQAYVEAACRGDGRSHDGRSHDGRSHDGQRTTHLAIRA